MALCKFFQQGNCRFGNSCRYEHTQDQGSNRFGALGGGGGGGGSNNGNQNLLDKYSIVPDTIKKDLTIEAPQWILSSYAPGKNAPEQLFGGFPREQSAEEMRFLFYQARAAGNEQGALSDAQSLYQNAQQQMVTASNDPDGAARFIVEAENKHPNRQDICAEGTKGQPFGEFLVGSRPIGGGMGATSSANPFSSTSSSQPAFGQPSQPASAFGQPSALGQKPNPFGQPSQSQPAFGQTSQPQSAFGQPSQPSAFGQPAQPAQPAFGQTSQPQGAFAAAGQSMPAFGQPSQPVSAFGQPSQLGAKPSPFGTPAFGQSSQPAPQSAFGQPSQLGQKPSPFGSTPNNAASPFAAAGNNGASGNNAPAANPFGSNSQGNAAASPFGAASNNQSTTNSSPFGQPSAPSNASPFGAAPSQDAKPNPFASTNNNTPNANNPFGQPSAQPNNAFAASSNQQQSQPNGAFAQQSTNSNPFGQPQQQPQPQQQSAASNAATADPYPPGSAKQHPPLDSYASKGMDGRLSQFKGKNITYKDGIPGYKDFNGPWQRIWFPDGPPPYNKDTEVLIERYDDKMKSQWAAFAQQGAFADGLMPELPPPRDCVRWDF